MSRHRIGSARTVLRGLVALPMSFLLVVGVAWGYWTAGSSPGGGGASAATVVNAGNTPTASSTGSSVVVSWEASTLSSGVPVTGYLVNRYDAITLALQTILTACTGTVTATTCTENGVPTGQWVYSVTPVFATNWRGATSPMSVPVEVDGDPPRNALALSSVTGAFLSGNTVFYRGISAGSFDVTNAVSDDGSGPASSATTALTGTASGWSHTASTVSTPTGGPYTSNPFSWTAGTTSGPSEVITGRDVAGNSTATTLSYLNDSTNPTAGSITYLDGLQPDQSVTVTFTTGTDSGSGIATRQLQRASSTLIAGTCGTFGTFANVGPDAPTSPYVDDAVLNRSCDKYRYVVTDRVGNQDIATSGNVAKVDFAGAAVPIGTAATYSVLAGTGVVNTDLTTLSGDLGVSPSSSVVGFPPGIVSGTIHAGDAAAAQAQVDLVAAYNDAASRTPSGSFAGDQNGVTFTAGVWHTTPAFALTGTMTLDGQGNPNAVFIFQVDAALNTAAASHISLINGAKASNVYWQVLGAVGTGASSTFVGTIMSAAAITLGDGTLLVGRALSYDTVTMAADTVRFAIGAPPAVTITGGATATTKTPTPIIAGTDTAGTGTTVTVTVGGQILTTLTQPDTSWSVTPDPLSNGPHTVVASVRNPAGDAGSASQLLTVALNPDPVALGTAAPYAVLAGTGVVSTGLTAVGGDLGESPGTAISGFPPGVVQGETHLGDATAAAAQADLVLAYNDAAGRLPTGSFAGDQIGKTFTDGVWQTSTAFALTGTMTLDGEGDPNAVFIFQVGAALNTAASSTIVLVNGAQASHVFWQVLGAAGLGATSTFTGSIMSAGSITIGAGAAVNGRALSYDVVTMAANQITSPTAPTTPITSDPTAPSGPVAGDPTAPSGPVASAPTAPSGPVASDPTPPADPIDSAAPSAGTITYADGYQVDQSVSVMFTTGTDSGSGIATRQLQRASATLTAGVCGTFSSFANVGADSRTSPYLDLAVTNGFCYQYRYVVTDHMGNADTATSTNAAKVGVDDVAERANATGRLPSQHHTSGPPRPEIPGTVLGRDETGDLRPKLRLSYLTRQ